jgi:hypothetical protein
MSWEAFRLTSKSPSEVLHVLGPHGVDDLIRKMLDACWRESPEEGRTFESVRRFAQQVWDRNLAVWSKIKKPSPQAFFENLLPHNPDQFLRQALVLCWMMLPRAGGRKFSDVKKIVEQIYQRNLQAWEADNATFTGKKRTAKRASKKAKPVNAKAAKTRRRKEKRKK